MKDVYTKLRERLDTYSFGFPVTESGIEMAILKKLFSEDDANLFLELSQKLESADDIAKRLNQPVNAIKEKLEDLVSRGLLFKQSKEIEKYAAIPFMHGIVEFNIKRVDKELASMLQKYAEEAYNANIAQSMDYFLHAIPVQKYVEIERHVASYYDVEKILDKVDVIAVAECFCRKKNKLLDKGCDSPLEACFMFGSMAQYYIDNNLGRRVDKEEALKIVAEAQRSGCVTQPSTSQNPAGMCNCCRDCCMVLGAIKARPNPADFVFSNHFSSIISERCTGCESCVNMCPMDAISIGDSGTAMVNLNRCIGCGLCLMACNFDAVKLNEKPEEKRRTLPANSKEQMLYMAKKRGLV